MQVSDYYRDVTAADEALARRQAEIVAAEDSGEVTVREAADMRIEAMTGHLAACQEARERHLERAS